MNHNTLLISLLFPILFGCTKTEKQTNYTNEEVKLTDSLKKIVSIDTVDIQNVTSELNLNGRVTFNQDDVARVYPIFGGTVTKIFAEIGDYVRKGDVLAEIRSGEVADYEKQLKEAEQQEITAKRSAEAKKDMYASGMASEQDVLQAQQELKTAQADVNRVKEIASIYNFSESAIYHIKSPVSGFVISRNISKDMQIRSDQNEELFTVSGLDNVWIMADVYESDIDKVHEGDLAEITTLAYKNIKLTGKIDKIYQALDEDSKTMNIRIRMQNNDHKLKPGMFANVRIKNKNEEGEMAFVKAHSLIFENGKNYVVVVNENEQLSVREVDIYRQSDDECFIRSGISAGEKILNNNALLVYNTLNNN